MKELGSRQKQFFVITSCQPAETPL